MAMQTSRTNEAVTGEADRLRENIDRLLDRLNVGELKGAEVFLYNYFGLEALNERQT